MKLGRDTLLNALLALVVIASAAWIVSNTEWVDEEVRLPARDDAARDRLYAIKHIASRLGATVESPQNLGRLPPANATLVLSAWNWDLFPERDAALRRWVESGGHLVVQGIKRPKWIGIDAKSVTARRPGPASAPAPAALPTPRERLARSRPPCEDVQEDESLLAGAQPPRRYRLCAYGVGSAMLTSQARPVWELVGTSGPQWLRVPFGAGRITTSIASPINNRDVFDGDNAAIFVAALDLRAGDVVWFADSETRLPLLKAIWQNGTPAVLLGALVIALALWRGGVRFGPRAPLEPLARRSVAEQIRGTASFIFRRDSIALHRAQIRALEQAARRIIRDHDRLERRARADAIALATALDADALARAMDPALKRARRELLTTLALLETAVRRLSLNH